MSAPSRPLVTIDDPVTIIEPHRVLLEWVDQVHREGFYVRSTTSGSHITIGALEKNHYRHDAEGTTWARGHHLPDSEVVIALRAATSLVPQEAPALSAEQQLSREMLKRVLPSLPTLPPVPKSMKDLMDELEKQAREESAGKPWTTRWMEWIKG